MNNEKTAELINLIKENPELPVVPIVDSEVVGDDGGNWLGSFGNCYVSEYAYYDDGYFDEHGELEEAYYNNHEEDYDGMSEEEIKKDLEEKTKDMWIKAIIVYVGLPIETV